MATAILLLVLICAAFPAVGLASSDQQDLTLTAAGHGQQVLASTSASAGDLGAQTTVFVEPNDSVIHYVPEVSVAPIPDSHSEAARHFAHLQRDATAVTSGGGAQPMPYSADWMQQVYDTSWLSANESATVAIVDLGGNEPDLASDLTTFRSQNGLPACSSCLNTINYKYYDGDPNASDDTLPNEYTGGEGEADLDIQAVASICPLCTIDVIELDGATDTWSQLTTAFNTAESYSPAAITFSWTAPDWHAGQPTDDSSPIFAPGGDALTGNYGQIDGVDKAGVIQPADQPYVTAVGGTDLVPGSNLRGVHESVWNDLNDGDYGSGGNNNAGDYLGSGSFCDASGTVPTFQSESFTDCDGRAGNDVSAAASPGLDVYDPAVCNPQNSQYSFENWCLVGGTSLATQLAGAVSALTGTAAGMPSTAYQPSVRSFLTDVSNGENEDESGQEPNITEIACPITVICQAGTGWDGPTGEGSVLGDTSTGGPGIAYAPLDGTYDSSPSAWSTGLYGNSTDTALRITPPEQGNYIQTVAEHSATIQVGIYPNGLSTTVTGWVCTNGNESGSCGTVSSATVTPTTSYNPGTANLTLGGLSPDTTYYYNVEATNADGSARGYTFEFHTSS